MDRQPLGGRALIFIAVAILVVACHLACNRVRPIAVAPVALTNLLAGDTNLLSPDGWSPINDQVAGHIDAGVLYCPSAPAGVAEVDKPGDPASAGWQQTVRLDQKVPAPVVAAVDVRSMDFSRKRLHDFALAVVLHDAGGAAIKGSQIFLSPETSNWQRVPVRVIPPVPAATATIRLVSLSQVGHAEFRRPVLTQLSDRSESVSIDGFILPADRQLKRGWWVVDMHDQDTIVPFEQADSLDLQATVTENTTGSVATVTDTAGRDRALTLLYILPIEGKNWQWLIDPRRRADAVAPGEYLSVTGTQGGRGQISWWPFAAVAKGADGRAIALDLDRPAIYRVGYSAGAEAMYLAIDIALTPEHPSAELGGCVFEFDGEDGFRGALAVYYERFPDSFRSRTPEHGLWMPFGYVRGLPNFEDFGFKFVEGLHEMAFDDANGLYSLTYVEPLTFWMNMPRDLPRNLENGLAHLDKLLEADDRLAKAFVASGYHDADGRWAGTGIKTAWCDGVVWSMNTAPGVVGENHFSMSWNDSIEEWVNNGAIDGIYIDSVEGYITDELNYRRDHFAAMDTPLTFDSQYRPVIHTGLIALEYTRAIAAKYHEYDKITMANATPGRYSWLATQLDVMGGEWDWNPGGEWTPPADAGLLYIRAMAGPKPYCILQNTNFKKWTRDHSERYMKRCVAYGMYPGFFSANAMTDTYFNNPKLYQRDRELFAKYVPLCKRVGEAGWQPITNARSSDRDVYVERWGAGLLTVFNDAGEERTVTVTLEGDWPATCTNLVSGETITITNGKLALTLDSEDVAVLAFE
jgi:hypothetical protein